MSVAVVDMAENEIKPDRSDGRGMKRERDNREMRGPRQDGRGGQGERERGNYPPRRMRQDPIRERMASVSGPTTNLPTREGGEQKKFTGRCRLFIGNLPSSITDDEFRNMFKPFGEIAEVFLNASKGFGFVKLDTKQNAETAKAALDFSIKDGKSLRVRFATHGAALKVKNLSGWVSNELLEAAFSIFGEVERAVVIVDDRGRPVGEGIIEYSRKQAAQTALKRCADGCFLLTSSPRPVLVEPLEQRDEEDGLPEKNFQKNNHQFLKERDIGPRLAEPGTFEYDFASRWKQLYEVERLKREHLEKEILEGRHQLEEQMEFSLYEHEANLLREKLRHMEEQGSMLQREREMRLDEERRRDEQRRQQELMLRQQQEEILRRRGGGDDRWRQEDNLMMQQEAALRQMQGAGSQNMDMGEHSLDNMAGGPSSNAGTTGPGSMMPGPGGMGIPPQRQSRFDQPPPYMGGPPGASGNHGNMGPPETSATGNINNVRGNGPVGNRGNPREMMDRRDHRDEFPADNKRRRY